ncbi:FAD-dependent oxidoreductase [Candidatus Parcubacteria bacterium]|jgi:ferredoxin-NADP reductase|nr:FAD-dependent oxidoreductase [Candidatus Parcubacteria bacterium]MBT3948506.1 FAD-dependent oxidoreductase [Candidatus Parcubacteria bacterium]
MNIYTSKIIEKKDIATDVWEIRFDKPDGFEFESGQFIQIVINSQEKEILRSYSISSTPDDPYIELCIKVLEDGIGSNFFRNCNEGDEIIFKQANGRFVVQDSDENLFFIATGAGLAPIMSIINNELNKKTRQKIHLLFGVRYEKNIFWQNRLEKLAKENNNFTYDISLSKPEDSWKGLGGRVSDHIPETVEKTDFYLCGSPPMVQDVRKILVDKGVDMKDVHFEIF